jgi:hypothetical protein
MKAISKQEHVPLIILLGGRVGKLAKKYCKNEWYICKRFGEAYFEYFESCDFSRQNTNIETIRCIRVYV